MKKRAIVLLSGGQDSVTCLFWALKNFDEVEAIGFYYGQRHSIELDCAQKICSSRKIPFSVLNVRDIMFGSSLVDFSQDVAASHQKDDSLPSSFTAGRNAIFLTAAASFAYNKDVFDLVTGTCQTDYSGYPDCRRVFIDSMVTTLTLATKKDFRIHTPLMYLTKAETWLLAKEISPECLSTIINMTNTCYKGDRSELHDWGYGCGECPACKLRKDGFVEAFKELYV